jgi:hypothetical protein
MSRPKRWSSSVRRTGRVRVPHAARSSTSPFSAISSGIALWPGGLSVGRGSGKRPNRALLTLLHGAVHHNTFAALGTDKGFGGRGPRERVQSVAMGAASATDLGRRHLHHDSGGEFHGHSPDDGAAFVAGYVSLIAAHVDNEAAATIRSCCHLVGDDQKALFIAGHTLNISRSAGKTRIGLPRVQAKVRCLHQPAILFAWQDPAISRIPHGDFLTRSRLLTAR